MSLERKVTDISYELCIEIVFVRACVVLTISPRNIPDTRVLFRGYYFLICIA